MKSNTKICIYSGRFQPFGPHHNLAYHWLIQRFGPENVFIATSNVTHLESPLNFLERKSVIEKFNIPSDKVIRVQNPYKAEEITSKFNPNTTSVIFAYGEKDFDRLSFIKKDGSKSYLRPYRSQEDLEPLSICGYAIRIPHIKVNGKEISGSWLRQTLPLCDPEEFRFIMGWYDEKIDSMFRKKFHPDIVEISKLQPKMNNQIFETIVNRGKYSKHIIHPFEDKITTEELIEFVSDLLLGKIDGSLKFDGHNFQITYKDGEVLASRNKSTIINPMTVDQVWKKFEGKPEIQNTFTSAHKAIREKLIQLSNSQLNSIFQHGRTFLNFEICHPSARNIFDYGDIPFMSLHSLVTYDENGNEVSRTNKVPEEFLSNELINGFEIRLTPHFNIPKMDQSHQFLNNFANIQAKYKSELISNIPEIRPLMFLLGNFIIGKYCDSENIDRNNVQVQKNIIEKARNLIRSEEDKVKFKNAATLLNSLGGSIAINPIEGIVVNWKDKIYKLTGSFGALVPIFGIYNKDRYK